MIFVQLTSKISFICKIIIKVSAYEWMSSIGAYDSLDRFSKQTHFAWQTSHPSQVHEQRWNLFRNILIQICHVYSWNIKDFFSLPLLLATNTKHFFMLSSGVTELLIYFGNEIASECRSSKNTWYNLYYFFTILISDALILIGVINEKFWMLEDVAYIVVFEIICSLHAFFKSLWTVYLKFTKHFPTICRYPIELKLGQFW